MLKNKKDNFKFEGDMKWVHQGSHLWEIVKMVQMGRELTIPQMAEILNVKEASVCEALVRARKKGFEYHPIFKGKRKNGNCGRGIVVDINKNKEFLRLGLNKYEDNCTLPHLKGIVRKFETGLMLYPGMTGEIQQLSDRLSMVAIKSREKARLLELEAAKEPTTTK